MKKYLLFFALIIISMKGFSTEESRFHLFTSKCQAESRDAVETSPQSPPLNVDDPETPGCNTWEVNVLMDSDITKTDKSWELPLLDIGYGIGDNLQVSYQVPMVKNQTEDQNQTNVGSSKVGVKFLFFEDEETDLKLALYPQVDFATPSTKVENDNSGTVTTIPVLLSKKLLETPRGDINLTTNFSYAKSTKPNTVDSASFAIGVGMPLIQKSSIMAEVATEQGLAKQDDIREQLVKFNIGVMNPIAKNWFAYGSAGKSIYSNDDKDHTYYLAGIRFIANGF